MKLSERIASRPSKKRKFECSTQTHNVSVYIMLYACDCDHVFLIHAAFFSLFFLFSSSLLSGSLSHPTSAILNMQPHSEFIYSITSFIKFLHILPFFAYFFECMRLILWVTRNTQYYIQNQFCPCECMYDFDRCTHCVFIQQYYCILYWLWPTINGWLIFSKQKKLPFVQHCLTFISTAKLMFVNTMINKIYTCPIRPIPLLAVVEL